MRCLFYPTINHTWMSAVEVGPRTWVAGLENFSLSMIGSSIRREEIWRTGSNVSPEKATCPFPFHKVLSSNSKGIHLIGPAYLFILKLSWKHRCLGIIYRKQSHVSAYWFGQEGVTSVQWMPLSQSKYMAFSLVRHVLLTSVSSFLLKLIGT